MLSSTRACSSNAYFEGGFLEGVSCRFGSLALGCCSSTSCSQSAKSVCVMHQKFLLKYFHERWKICEIKDPRKYSAIQYFPSFYYKSKDGLIVLIGLHEWQNLAKIKTWRMLKERRYINHCCKYMHVHPWWHHDDITRCRRRRRSVCWWSSCRTTNWGSCSNPPWLTSVSASTNWKNSWR